MPPSIAARFKPGKVLSPRCRSRSTSSNRFGISNRLPVVISGKRGFATLARDLDNLLHFFYIYREEKAIIKPYPLISRLTRITDPVIHLFRLLFTKQPTATVREIPMERPAQLFSKAGALSARNDLHWLVGSSFIINNQSLHTELLIAVNTFEYEPNAYAIMLVGHSGASIFLEEFLQLNDLSFNYSNYL